MRKFFLVLRWGMVFYWWVFFIVDFYYSVVSFVFVFVFREGLEGIEFFVLIFFCFSDRTVVERD